MFRESEIFLVLRDTTQLAETRFNFRHVEQDIHLGPHSRHLEKSYEQGNHM